LCADTPPAVATLMATIQEACQAKDLDLIKSCYDFDGVPDISIDQSLNTWQEFWNEHGDTAQYAFDKIDYRSLQDLHADKTMNQGAILAMIEPQKMGYHTYSPNLPVVGFITVHFKVGLGSTGSMEPVGLSPNGTAKLVVLRQAP
jgi:hypothetical protein